MKVQLSMHGGQAAGINIRMPPRVVDTEALPAPAAAEVSRLVGEAKVAAEPPVRDDRTRDAMSYSITIEDRGQSTVLAQSDATMSREFAALLSWLESYHASR